MATLKSFEELDCWKASFEVKIWVMEIIKQFPKEERYDLIDNMNE